MVLVRVDKSEVGKFCFWHVGSKNRARNFFWGVQYPPVAEFVETTQKSYQNSLENHQKIQHSQKPTVPFVWILIVTLLHVLTAPASHECRMWPWGNGVK